MPARAQPLDSNCTHAHALRAETKNGSYRTFCPRRGPVVFVSDGNGHGRAPPARGSPPRGL
eukprot:4114073-Alexandrium_andersonii.AAC.1